MIGEESDETDEMMEADGAPFAAENLGEGYEQEAPGDEAEDAEDAEEVTMGPMLLDLVAGERVRSIGFDHDDELATSRNRALEYFKGEMNDWPAMPNRSSAVTTDVADAIETLLPDLIEIFTGGDDVATFRPVGEEDEKAAEQETNYIRHVVFNENPGFMLLYTFFKDALLQKVGVLKVSKEETPNDPVEYTGQSIIGVQAAEATGEVLDLALSAQRDVEGNPLYDFKIATAPTARVRIHAVPPNDFTVAKDTVDLNSATYCAMRARPRAQDLIARGIAADLVEQLPAYSAPDEVVDLARDTAGEHSQGRAVSDSSDPNLRIVETVEHYVRVLKGPKLCLYRVLTGADETVLLEEPEEVDRVPFAAVTPYPQTHRFYGLSVADLVMENQKIRTSLKRILLDGYYFAQNQRYEISEQAMSKQTIADLLNNVPGMPVRSKNGQAVRAISAGSLNVDVFGALEFESTAIEQRTGIVRNAQGLNPDTLHDTAKGAKALMAASQKRVRLIARVFAETGVKDLFLIVHALIRQGGFQRSKVRLNTNWIDIDPTEWGARSDMAIEVGLGSGGAEEEGATLDGILLLQEKIASAQEGLQGPLLDMKNVYNALIRRARVGGLKKPEMFFTDPSAPPAPGAEVPQPEAPEVDPRIAEAQAKMALAKEEADARIALQQQQASANAELAKFKAEKDHELAVMRMNAEFAAKKQSYEAELALKERLAVAERDLKRQMSADAAMAGEPQMGSADIGQVHMGGEPG